MENQTPSPEILAAVRARLALDVGLGIEFLPGTIDPECFGTPPPQRAREHSARRPTPEPRPEYDAGPPERPPHDEGQRTYQPPVARPPRASPTPTPRTESRPSLVPLVNAAVNPEKDALLADLRAEAGRCRECGLCERRNSVVWGEGSLDAQVMFIGEGPGRDEDLEGRPFVGRSGRLLTDIIEKGMKVPRNAVYITNVVKCRPPGNRDPQPDEVAACSRYLNRQIAVIAPRIIVAVGGVAGCALLGLPPKTSGLRGRWHSHLDIPVRVIYHPSYLLRQRRSAVDRTQADKDTWKDIQEVMARL